MYNHGLLKFGSLANTLHLMKFQPTLTRTKLSKHNVHMQVGLEREI